MLTSALAGKPLPLLAAAALCCLVWTSAASGQEAVLTEQESVRLALTHPDVEQLAEALQAGARSELDAAGRWPNPVLDMQRESMSGPSRSTERTTLLSQQFDVAGKRSLRRGAASERLAAAGADAQQRRIDLTAETRRRFYEALYRKELVAAAQAWDQHMEAIGSTVQKLHKGGEVAGYDRRRIALERASAQARLRTEQAAYDRAWQQLAALLGRQASAATPAGQLLPADPAPLDSLLATLDQRPALRAQQARAAAFTLEHQAARRGWIPDITVGVGSKTVDNGLARERGNVVALSVPLPLFDREQAAAGKAAAQAREAQSQARLDRARLEGDVRGLWQQVRQLAAAAREYGAESVSESAELVRIAEASYRGGESGILELLDAYRAAHEAQARALELNWTARQGAIELDTIAGSTKP